MLSNSIALITLAVMLASEGKRTEGWWRHGLFTLATIIALVALALVPITHKLPTVGTALSSIFGQPLAWFVLFMGLFFVLRPFWQSRSQEAAASRPELINHAAKSGVPAHASVEIVPTQWLIRLSNLDNGVEQLGTQLTELTQSVFETKQNLERQSETLDKLTNAKRAEGVLEKIAQVRPMIEKALANSPIPLSEQLDTIYSRVRINNGYHRSFAQISGFSDGYAQMVTERQADVRTDARFCVMEGNDATFFRDGAEKQAFHLEMAKIFCAKERLDYLEERANNAIAAAKR